MKSKYLWAGSIIGIVLLLDQATKYLIEKHVRLFEVIPVIPGFFNITHVRNKGAAFSLFAGAPEEFRTLFFTTVTIVAIVVIILLIRKTNERLLIAAFSLISGGAAGNLIDRVRYGEVVDFIQWYVKSYYWPSFNVADSAITVGVCLLVVDMLFHKKDNVGSKRPANR
ncbi:MAG TPA: signal peptidase II [Nitrospirota bacterium]|nr:signal peptidase II [Nitrospirota bacterium]